MTLGCSRRLKALGNFVFMSRPGANGRAAVSHAGDGMNSYSALGTTLDSSDPLLSREREEESKLC
ncbi:hypothetical protein L249_2954 [Ophiocordyceps polyrhachis-furcata BCC 54312]|uniref:Uncharacterized protein n=1 Tax=Ophiocordyceps polyrhachis-furcata BCC 54312 TaxID=1330021 RepID=A0A367LQD3_9HYPO|nr:hypothetical protein L249_2954 [Ophiocordyceps polyrhachis-furcata BCC 54312]